MLPELSREMPVPRSELPPPKCVVVFVVELINDTNTCESKLSALESTPVTFVVIMFVGKFLDCVKPAISAVPLASTAVIAWPASSLPPPRNVQYNNAPLGSNSTNNASDASDDPFRFNSGAFVETESSGNPRDAVLPVT